MNSESIEIYRVYSEDVDHMGIMYHANHLRFFERARTELLRTYGMLLPDLANKGIHFAIHDIRLRYCAPARLDDLLTIITKHKTKRTTTLQFDQVMKNQSGVVLCEAEIDVVCLNDNYKPKRLPENLSRQAL